MLDTKLPDASRRTALKISALSAALIALPAWSTKVIAQVSNAAIAKVSSPKPNGLISFNAGWMIPVEDRKALLELEDAKIKEAQAALPKTNQSVDTPVDAVKSTKKTLMEKLQDTWKQVKNHF